MNFILQNYQVNDVILFWKNYNNNNQTSCYHFWARNSNF